MRLTQRRLLFLFLAAICIAAAADQKKEPDVLIFQDGEKLIGHLLRASGTSVTFKSDMAGEVTADWSKVSELHTTEAFAVIPKTVKVVTREVAAGSPLGSLDLANKNVEVKPASGTAASVPLSESPYVVNAADFRKYVESRRGYLSDWKGSLTGGLSLVKSTENSYSYTGAINLSRTEPAVDWLARNNRTLVDFSASYGQVTTPGQPSVKTEIYHADGERDEYFSPSGYGFAQAVFDHNFSQGLNLEQQYGGGVGWTVVKNAKTQLDLKVSMSYVQQSFDTSLGDRHLIASTFADTYMHKFARLTFTQALTLTPTWNDRSASSAQGSAGLVFPAYKRLNLSLNASDEYFNAPPPGFRKNSFQFTAGLNYALP